MDEEYDADEFLKNDDKAEFLLGDDDEYSAPGPNNKNNRYKSIRTVTEMDDKFGFRLYKDVAPRVAWLLNMHPGEIIDDNDQLLSVVNYYFLEEDGSRFKVSLPYKPYFYLASKEQCEKEVCLYLSKKYAGDLHNVEILLKDDLDLPNHLIGLKRTFLKLSFLNVTNLLKVRKDLMPRIRKNREKEKSRSAYSDMLSVHFAGIGNVNEDKQSKLTDQVDNIVDIREYDVPYHVRVSIDLQIFVGQWYTVIGRNSEKLPEIRKNSDLVDRPEPIVLAFDIETTKEPLKFPDSQFDKIMMISYMIDGQGYLIVNREIVSADVENFEYTPRPEYEGQFKVFNEQNEYELLIRFFEHVQLVKPHIFVTYNGDFFDWPFLEARAASYGLNLTKEIGFSKDSQGEYKSSQCIHMDAFRWVKRDSYLPMGSQNLKACTKAKLRYDPQELDPELMVQMAKEQPKVLASYSVSDAVATYYLYMKYVHPFIFALCTIIPMEPDEVLRKGSGTLCETLLMVQAYHCNIIFPNKQEPQWRKLTADGRLIDSETYVGGHVEAVESGVFRDDLSCRFRLGVDLLTRLRRELGRTMRYSLEMEGVEFDHVTDFEQKCAEIDKSLEDLCEQPNRLENPIIYHLDVGAMYPNIILTNRLQPQAIIDDSTCAACDFNRPGAKCQRKMQWLWRAEVAPANRSEYQRILHQLENETFNFNGSQKAFHQLPKEEQAKIEKKRLQDYCRKAYRRLHDTRSELKEVTVCQRENSFYVDTVRAFRDRRYEYKNLLKVAKKNLDAAVKSGDATQVKSCKSKEVVYDSLQLAHKCILNSFYGYVMRKGSRWHSMEMAGIVCYTGAQIITKAKELVEQIGRPLELDTDGIWCALPCTFPEQVIFRTTNPKRPHVTVSYPGAALNLMIRDDYTNHQYHNLVDQERKSYKITSENSISFEVDGPYKAMVLPASKEEGKKLKKRYAVFNFDGSLAELKGFEVKRRGELQLIKNFQSSVFDAFLKGATLDEVYQCAASVADYWLDVLFSKASTISDKELFDLLSENRNLSRKLADYGNQKSTSITVAKRLAEFLGDQMVKDAGLNCKIIIAAKPEGAPVTERAIPLVIFQAELSVRCHYLKKWTKCSNLTSYDIREILDWPYYIERLGSAIQKIVTIPAALQGVSNPVPRVSHPDWLHKRLLEKTDIMKQKRITDMFKKVDKSEMDKIENTAAQTSSLVVQRDIEEIDNPGKSKIRGKSQILITRNRLTRLEDQSSSVTMIALSTNRKNWREVLGPAVPPIGSTKEQRKIWLEFLKKKWAYQRKQRREDSQRTDAGIKRNFARSEARSDNDASEFAEKSANFNSKRFKNSAAGIDNFVQRSVRSLFESPWKIVQILESAEPGLFYLWVFVDQELRKIRLTVPRIFYINSKIPKEPENTEVYTKVNRILPRCNQVYNLYKYQVPEDRFQQHLNELLIEANTPNYEGIYETQVPLKFRLLVDLGCVCKLQASRRIEAFENNTFTLNDLEFLSLIHCDYLESEPYKHAFLYHYVQDSRAIWSFIVPGQKKGEVWILDRGQNKNVPNLNALYNSERSSRLKKAENNNSSVNNAYGLFPDESIQFAVQVHGTAKDIYLNIQRAVRAYQDEKRGSTLLSCISPFEPEYLVKLMPSLAEFPLIKLRINQPDNLFSTLDWQRVGCRYMINYFLNFLNYFQSYLDLCRYLHIPIGNVPKDFTTFGADLFFARHLQKQNCLLWASPSDRPDLGGKEVDNNCLVTDFIESQDIKINEPGFYTYFCVELDVASLPVAAILQSHKISEYEGVNSAVQFDHGHAQFGIEEMASTNRNGGGPPSVAMATTYDETALCSYAFRILKTMVHAWVRDVANSANKFADNQIIHFYRWLRSSNSLLYEPALKKILNGLMKKLFLLLIAELKRLNVTVLYANSAKIIACTKKRTYDDALAYANFILENLHKKDLFSLLDITVTGSWRILMWLDPANFGGIKYEEESANKKDEIPENKEDDDDEITVDMNWIMMYFLPEMADCQANFSDLIAGYILLIYRFIENRLNQSSKKSIIDRDPDQDQIEPKEVDPGRNIPDESNDDVFNNLANRKFDDVIVQYCRQLVSGEISKKLTAVVRKIHHKIMVNAGDVGVGELFPNLPGSHLKLTNPALEFAKAMCKAFSLDANLHDETLTLKRTLLKCIGIGEFSAEAEWLDPCLSYVLPEIICKSCGHCRDVDLCRDPCIYDEPNVFSKWRCVRCNKEYDVAEIEEILLQHLNKWIMSYTLQDFKCVKCRMVKLGNLNNYCECSGDFSKVMSSEDVDNTLKVFSNLAKFYKMNQLKEALKVIADLCPSMKKMFA